MSTKNAAFLAFIGTLLLTIVAALDFFRFLSGALHGVIPAVTLGRELIYLIASLTVTVFFWVFSRSPRA